MADKGRKREAPKTYWSVVFLLIGLALGCLFRKAHLLPEDDIAFALPVVLLLLAGNIMDIMFGRKVKRK